MADTYGTAAAPGYLLSDDQVRLHQYRYKQGQLQFQQWLTAAVGHDGEIKLNFFLTLAKKFKTANSTLPDEALFNLKSWLWGRTVCYCHHLYRGDADDGHLHPIRIARELLRLLRPDDATSIIAGCTPPNLDDLLATKGSPEARELFGLSRVNGESCQTESSSTDHNGEDRLEHIMSERSWRRASSSSISSISSSTSSSSVGSWRSKRSSLPTSPSTAGSWRSKSASPSTSPWSAGSWRSRTSSPAAAPSV